MSNSRQALKHVSCPCLRVAAVLLSSTVLPQAVKTQMQSEGSLVIARIPPKLHVSDSHFLGRESRTLRLAGSSQKYFVLVASPGPESLLRGHLQTSQDAALLSSIAG